MDLSENQMGKNNYTVLSQEQGNTLLRQVAVMNIKRCDGRNSSSYGDISVYANTRIGV